MAVVQISRIQIRRGQANQGTGLPQLASGEMAWAIDAQELYIGNGSVSEGAPAVGVTKILTTNDLSAQGNLLGSLQYIYKTNDTTIITGTDVNHPISRTLQDRLDDRVSTIEFGSVGDGSTDDTTALQRAINELFLNSNNKASAQTAAGTSVRSTLEIPAGVYKTTSPLYIPSYATLRGAGVDKTIIYYNPTSTITGSTNANNCTITTTAATALMVGASITGTNIPDGSIVTAVTPGVRLTINNNNPLQSATLTATGSSFTIILSQPAIQFVNDTSTLGHPSTISSTLYTNQPRHIHIDGITVETATGQNICMQLDAVRSSLFENISLKGNWTVTANPSTNSIGILMQSFGSLATCETNTFTNLTFDGFYYGVYSDNDIINNTFENSYFTNCQQAIALGLNADGQSAGQQFGPRETIVDNCKFYLIQWQAIVMMLGTGNTVSNSQFINVGSNGAGAIGAEYPEIYFAKTGNTTKSVYSDRSATLSVGNLTTPYIPEVSGNGFYQSFGTHEIILQEKTSPVLAFRLPCPVDQLGATNGIITYCIEYFYTSTLLNSYSRGGTITLIADTNRKNIQLSDEFDFAGTDPSDTTCLKLDFSANFLDQTGNAYTGAGGQIVSSIAVDYSNSLSSDLGYLNYSYISNFRNNS